MKKLILILGMLALCVNAYAEDISKGSYEEGFSDGWLSSLIFQLESSIEDDYDLLTMLESQKGKEIGLVKERLIRNLNGNLCSLGQFIEDIRNQTMFSPHFAEYQKKEDEDVRQSFGKERMRVLDSVDLTEFWKKLKIDWEQKNWKIKTKGEGTETEFANKVLKKYEKYTNLALDTYSKYGGAFIEE